MFSKKYLKWMAVHSFSSSISSVISTNSMLSSIMVKQPSYTSIVATNYIGKDIIGQLGVLMYVWKTGKNSDKYPLNYITKGGLILQASFFLENAAPLINNNSFVLPFLGFCSILKNISFISIGAVNAKNIQKICEGNMGEFYSKVASINTISSTMGMIVGIGIIYIIPCYNIRSYVVLPITGMISMYSLRKATKLLN